jgi:hypothetical protein
MLLFDMLRAQCQHADLSSDIRTPPIWSSTISEVDLITKNSQIDWQECNNWRGKRSWHLEQMVAWCCLGPSTLLLVMPQLYQMITKLEMSNITYVHTVRKETFTIQVALEKAANPDMTKHILKARTQMVESMYKYFDTGLSESHRPKSEVVYLHVSGPKVQEVQHVANT